MNRDRLHIIKAEVIVDHYNIEKWTHIWKNLQSCTYVIRKKPYFIHFTVKISKLTR